MMSSLGDPCPFCGGPAKVFRDGPSAYVGCANRNRWPDPCPVGPATTTRQTVDEAVTVWNTRAVETELVEALNAIQAEAIVANDVIRLNRDGGGNGRVKVATAMHRVAEIVDAAIAKAVPR